MRCAQRFHTLAWASVCLLAAAAGAAGQAPHAARPPSAKEAATAAYRIGPGDVLAIDVWHEPEISRSLPVGPDGRLSLPMAGEIQASGLTAEELQEAISLRLKKYINDPAVTVMLQDAESRRYNVLDMVNHPGSYPLIHPTTVLDAIAAAGGLRDFAHPKRIYLIRKRASDGVEVRFNFDYTAVSLGLHPEQNIQLQADDTIVVP